MGSINVRSTLGTKKESSEATLRRVVLASLLWEDQFYIDGESSAELVSKLVSQSDPKAVQALAIEARTKFKLRHIPLLLARELARKGNLPSNVLTDTIQRADEMGEFLSIYWKDGKTPVSSQVKKGLAACFNKFNEYQLAKFDKNSAKVSVRDVMFLTHPKPTSPEQAELFKRIAEQKMATPDTWETNLSGGADKKATFERLMAEKKLGALAFLRNLRNMWSADVIGIREYANSLDVSKVLPFRYIAAARIVPEFEDMLETLMFKSLAAMPKLKGKTVLLVDVSGSMFGAKVSAKSDLYRFDAAAALAVMLRELCDSVEIYSFSDNLVKVAPRRGFALVDAIRGSQSNMGTYLGKSLRELNQGSAYDRVMVFTDEQSSDVVPASRRDTASYMINVAAYEHGVSGNNGWINITGFSEAIVDYIQAIES